MIRHVVLAAVLAVLAAGCPDTEAVGGAPKAQVDMAKKRLDKASEKLETSAAKAAATVDE